jgi:hypothetical protein
MWRTLQAYLLQVHFKSFGRLIIIRNVPDQPTAEALYDRFASRVMNNSLDVSVSL